MLVSQEDIVGCRIAGVVFENSQLSVEKLHKINAFRKCLSAVWRLTSLSNTRKLDTAKQAFETLFKADSTGYEPNKAASNWVKVIEPPVVEPNGLPWEEPNNVEQSKPLMLEHFDYYPQFQLNAVVPVVAPNYSAMIPQTEV